MEPSPGNGLPSAVQCCGAVLVASLALWCAVPASAQGTLSAEGVIESTSGGFRFPDGSMQTTAAAAMAPVEVTGQETCYAPSPLGSSQPVPCDGTGQDGDKLTGVTWPSPRFVDNQDGTVTDLLTGLVWLAKADCYSLNNQQNALVQAAQLADGACGLADGSSAGEWRVPQLKELLSLLDFGRSSPALPAGHLFVGVLLDFGYWSSTLTADPGFGCGAWGVYLEDGESFRWDDFGVFGYLLPVRGGR